MNNPEDALNEALDLLDVLYNSEEVKTEYGLNDQVLILEIISRISCALKHIVLNRQPPEKTARFIN